MGHVYRHLALAAGVDTIIDSSKNPATVPIIDGIDDVEMYVVHVVRDLRGVIYSWSKDKLNPGNSVNMPKWKPWETALTWTAHNLACQSLSGTHKYRLLRYEDFSRNPRSAMQSLVESIPPISDRKLAFESETRICLPALHSVSGNPHRFDSGMTDIAPDYAWSEKLSPVSKWFGTVVGYPLLRRYGYLS